MIYSRVRIQKTFPFQHPAHCCRYIPVGREVAKVLVSIQHTHPGFYPLKSLNPFPEFQKKLFATDVGDVHPSTAPKNVLIELTYQAFIIDFGNMGIDSFRDTGSYFLAAENGIEKSDLRGDFIATIQRKTSFLTW